jgi:hypothetical protein
MDFDDKKNNRRTKLLIDPKFQGRFLLNMVVLNLVVCGIFYAAQAFFFRKAFEVGKSIGLAPDNVFFNFVGEQERFMNVVFIGTALMVSVIIVVFGLMYSNKIAGPLFHLRKHLKARMNGKTKNPLKFRDGDNFKELADAVNEYIAWQESSKKRSA